MCKVVVMDKSRFDSQKSLEHFQLQCSVEIGKNLIRLETKLLDLQLEGAWIRLK